MIVPQWVIGCGYITLQTLFHLLRLLGRWLGNTILIKLMYAKMRLASQAYQWHTCWSSPWKKTKNLSYIHREAFATYVEITGKSSSTVGITVPEMWWLLRMSARYVGLGKVWVWKSSRLWAVKNRHGGRASASFYKVPWKRYQKHKISCIWGKEQIDKGRHRLWCKCLISLLFRWCNALWHRHAGVVNKKPFD